MSKTVGLVMIVKNEELTLPRLATSVRHQLDYWTIVDTGSTDRTPQMTPELFDGVPGQLIEDRFRGFGPSRNVALEAARGHTDWMLTIDADETVEGNLRGALNVEDADAIEARLEYANLSYWRTSLLSSESPWRWDGRAHEFLTLGEPAPRLARTDAFHVFHHADGGNHPDKLERELGLLEEDLEEKPEDSRTAFYLARTHEDMGHVQAAADFYRRRIALEGWDEETWYSRWRLGTCLLRLGRIDEGIGVLLHAWGERPWRAEPLATLMEHYRLNSQWPLCWEMGVLATRYTGVRPDGKGRSPDADRLFVHQDVYQWRVAYERSICAWYVNEPSTGRRLCDYLMRLSLPAEIQETVTRNRTYYAR